MTATLAEMPFPTPPKFRFKYQRPHRITVLAAFAVTLHFGQIEAVLVQMQIH